MGLLYEEYVKNHKSVYEIADEYTLGIRSVWKLLDEYNIPIRTYQESMKIYYDEHNGREIKRQQSLEMWANDEFHSKMCEINRESSNKKERRIAQSAALQHISVEEWEGFITSDNNRERGSFKYDEWRSKVFERDNYTCQCCRDHTGLGHSVVLNAHHIRNFSENIDLRFDVDNGITLCDKCHSQRYKNSFHTIYGTRDNTPEQLYEYIEQRQKELGILERK